MNYKKAMEFIDNSFVSFQNVGLKAYNEGLEGITEMCRYLGDPQRDFPVIHIAGTNGKGSVAHMLTSILQSAGYCVGLFTSPHLNDFRERIRVSGNKIPKKSVANFIGKHGKKMKELDISYFEMTAAMAFKHFSKSGVEVAVIETGMGGRLDATNIVTPLLSIITNVGFDHTEVLGDTIEKIAAEKAGIIKSGVPVLIGEKDELSAQVFIKKAEEAGSMIVFAEDSYECVGIISGNKSDCYEILRKRDGAVHNIELDLKGTYQAKNLVTARAAVSLLRHHTNLNISAVAMTEGFRNVTVSTGLKGRWQTIRKVPLTIADAGHNVHAIRYLNEQLKGYEYGKLYMIIGISADKDLPEMLSLMPKDAHYIFPQAVSERITPAAELAREAEKAGLKGETAASVREALDKAYKLASPQDLIFIGGSIYVIGEII